LIVADTGAIVALIDADDDLHETFRGVFDSDRDAWLLPWAILPEVDYLLSKYVGSAAEEAFVYDIAQGLYRIEWGNEADLRRAHELARRYRDLSLGLVDAVVMAVAERKNAEAIATTDERDFGAVEIRGEPKILPRDLE
jgi:predicted nucleic acid-binding protein